MKAVNMKKNILQAPIQTVKINKFKTGDPLFFHFFVCKLIQKLRPWTFQVLTVNALNKLLPQVLSKSVLKS